MRIVRDEIGGNGKLKLSYDPEVDALYIRIVEGKQECRTLRLNEDIALNVGPGEVLVGIEILDASHVLGEGRVPAIELENLEAIVGNSGAGSQV